MPSDCRDFLGAAHAPPLQRLEDGMVDDRTKKKRKEVYCRKWEWNLLSVTCARDLDPSYLSSADHCCTMWFSIVYIPLAKNENSHIASFFHFPTVMLVLAFSEAGIS